jgi:putative PIN family toxin of toxin-antitoxin system
MVKLVVDTNLVVSALLKPQSNPALVISLILRGDCSLCLTKDIMTEYAEVLAREKFQRLDRPKVNELLSKLKKLALWIEPKVSLHEVVQDPADNALLECALEAKAEFLITGNIHHFPFKKYRQTLIVTPAEFMAHIIERGLPPRRRR